MKKCLNEDNHKNMHAIYLDPSRRKRIAGRNASQGFYKEKPTEPSWQYAHLHEREGKGKGFSVMGGGQNANKLCKKPFAKPP